jgi:Translation initiation factor IF-2, N-terminal region
MLCDECNERPATVFLTQIVGGVRARRSLCESCAASIMEQLPAAEPDSDRPPLDPEVFARPLDCPSEVTLGEPTTVRELASVLHAKNYQVVAVLMQHKIFSSPNTSLDFATASLVCTHYGVTPRKIV